MKENKLFLYSIARHESAGEAAAAGDIAYLSGDLSKYSAGVAEEIREIVLRALAYAGSHLSVGVFVDGVAVANLKNFDPALLVGDIKRQLPVTAEEIGEHIPAIARRVKEKGGLAAPLEDRLLLQAATDYAVGVPLREDRREILEAFLSTIKEAT